MTFRSPFAGNRTHDGCFFSCCIYSTRQYPPRRNAGCVGLACVPFCHQNDRYSRDRTGIAHSLAVHNPVGMGVVWWPVACRGRESGLAYLPVCLHVAATRVVPVSGVVTSLLKRRGAIGTFGVRAYKIFEPFSGAFLQDWRMGATTHYTTILCFSLTDEEPELVFICIPLALFFFFLSSVSASPLRLWVWLRRRGGGLEHRRQSWGVEFTRSPFWRCGVENVPAMWCLGQVPSSCREPVGSHIGYHT